MLDCVCVFLLFHFVSFGLILFHLVSFGFIFVASDVGGPFDGVRGRLPSGALRRGERELRPIQAHQSAARGVHLQRQLSG